jgi:O-antigen/teichoic acid export membrane protein
MDLTRACVVTLPLLGGYCLFVALFARPLLALVYGPDYASESWVLTLYAVFPFISDAGRIVAAALLARRLEREVFLSYLSTALIVVPVAWFLIPALGIYGAVLSLIGRASLGTSFLLWRGSRHRLEVRPMAQANGR